MKKMKEGRGFFVVTGPTNAMTKPTSSSGRCVLVQLGARIVSPRSGVRAWGSGCALLTCLFELLRGEKNVPVVDEARIQLLPAVWARAQYAGSELPHDGFVEDGLPGRERLRRSVCRDGQRRWR